jgi:small subunit ribosomal protein S16
VVKLRLMRMGKKKQPTYRIVAADARSPRDGRFIEIIGHYNPRTEPSTIVVDNDKAVAWLSKGAQPTDSVRKLLAISGALDAFETGKASKAAS